MTPGQLREAVSTNDVYKMSLGRSAEHRKEGFERGVLVFGSEVGLYDAVVSQDEALIDKAGRLVKGFLYPKAGAPTSAVSVWRRSIETFRSLPPGSLVLHSEADVHKLHWGISREDFRIDREELNEFGQRALVLHRDLSNGWQNSSIAGVPLTNIHPKAQELAVNMATLNRVQTHSDYFRALILDEDTSKWEALPEWKAKAAEAGWYPKDRASLLDSKRAARVTPQVVDIADHFDAEIKRMAATATHTAANANGQIVELVVKNKEIAFTRGQLEDEIAFLLKDQKHCCALTGYDLKRRSTNPHLKPSLDRKDSSLGYVPGNLQIVTRAANFYKSASDEKDWRLKSMALEHMAAAIQRRRREGISKVDA